MVEGDKETEEIRNEWIEMVGGFVNDGGVR